MPRAGSKDETQPSSQGLFAAIDTKSIEGFDGQVRARLITTLSGGCGFTRVNQQQLKDALKKRNGAGPSVDIKIQWEAMTNGLHQQISPLSEPTQLTPLFSALSTPAINSPAMYRRLYGRLIYWDQANLTPTEQEDSLTEWVGLPTVLAHTHMHLACYRQHDVPREKRGFHQDLASLIEIQFSIDGIERFLAEEPASIAELAIQAYRNSRAKVKAAATNRARIEKILAKKNSELHLGQSVCPEATPEEQALIGFWLTPPLQQKMLQAAIKIDGDKLREEQAWLEKHLTVVIQHIQELQPSALTDDIRAQIDALHSKKMISDKCYEQLCGMLPEHAAASAAPFPD